MTWTNPRRWDYFIVFLWHISKLSHLQAAKLLKEAKKAEPDNAVVLLHLGELRISQNDFEGAVRHLRKAQRCVPFYHSNRGESGASVLKERERVERVSVEDIQANIAALLGISLFRINPSRPEVRDNDLPT